MVLRIIKIFSRRFLQKLLVALIIAYPLLALSQEEYVRRESNPILTHIAAAVVARVKLEDAERAWLQQGHSVNIRVGRHAPFHFVSDSTPAGLSIDYVRVICAAWQLNCYFVIGMGLQQALAATAKTNGIDLFTALRRSPERDLVVLFTRPYISSPYVIVVRDNDEIHQLEDLKGHRIVLERGDMSVDLVRATLPDADIIEVDNPTQALSKVSLQEADAFIGARLAVDFIMKEIGLNNLYIAGSAPFPPNTLSIAVRRDWPELASLINKTVVAMRDDERMQIIEYWQPIDRGAVILRETAFRWSVVLTVATLLVTSIVWIMRLRAEINTRSHVQKMLEAERAFLEIRVLERTNAMSNAKEVAERANQTKNQFLAVMSHELRTPLSGMLGLVRLLLNSQLSLQQRQWLDAIRDAGQAELAQLSDILELSRIESGHLDIYPEVCDLPALVEVTTVIFSEPAQEKGLIFTVNFDPQLPHFVLIDPRRIRQILSNLLNNAIRFTDAGQITFSITSQNERLDFTVSDTGIGIASEALTRIFEPFVQENTAINRSYGGSGLGLAICQRLATAMSGHIECLSQPGQGSIFRFEIPLKSISEPIISYLPHHNLLSSLLILLVEDNALNRMATAALLETLGHRVVVTENGEQALAECELTHFDLILADIHMPSMDGLEFVTILRQRSPRIDNLVFALTADLTANTERQAALLFDAILTKPFDENEFYRALKDRMHFDRQCSPLPPSTLATDGLDREHLAHTLSALPMEKRANWLQLARDTLTTACANIRCDITTGNWQSLAKEAHQLISSAAIIGLVDLQKIARELEQSAHQKNPAVIQQLTRLYTLLPQILQLLEF